MPFSCLLKTLKKFQNSLVFLLMTECFFDLPTILSELMCSAPPKLSHVFRRCTSEFKWIHFNSFNPLTTPPPLLCWEGGIELATKFKFSKRGGGGLTGPQFLEGGDFIQRGGVANFQQKIN